LAGRAHKGVPNQIRGSRMERPGEKEGGLKGRGLIRSEEKQKSLTQRTDKR